MAYSDNFPAQRPVFQADFANGGRIDPRATFTRASTANVWDGSKHLSSDNLLLQSSDFDTTWFSQGLTSRTGGQTDPSGGTSGFTLLEDSATNFHRIAQSIATNGELALTVYAKRNAGSRYLNLTIATSASSTGAGLATFDLAGGATHTSNGASSTLTNLSATQTASGNGYYKCVFKATATTATSFTISLGDAATPASNNYGLVLYTGDGSSSLDVAFASLSTTGATDYNATTTQIHREYAPSLVSKSNNVGRFDYSTDGQSAGTSLGILIEGASTNLAPYSSDITQSFFSAYQSNRDSNVAIAPDGTLTADLLRDDSSSPNTDHSLYWTYSSGGATPQTISFYAKAAGRTHVKLRFSVTSDGVFPGDDVYFDVENGAVGTTDSDITASIESCGNGWYRCIATRTAQASGVGQITLYLANANGSFTYSGDSYSGVLLWGIQIEANASFASSLISSNGSATTRAAESLSVAMADVGVSQGPVSAVVEGSAGSGSTPHLISLSDGTTVNRWAIYRDSLTADTSTDYRLFVRTDNSSVVSKVVSGSASATKFAMRIDTDNFAVCADGGTVETDTAGVAPVTTTIHIADDYNGGNQANGHIKRLALYGDLSDTNLQALTS